MSQGSRHRSLQANWVPQAQKVAQGVRTRVLEHTLKQNGGYLSQACSSAELLSALYTRLMKLGPSVAPAIPRSFGGAPGPGNPHSFSGAGYNGPKGPHLDRFLGSPQKTENKAR